MRNSNHPRIPGACRNCGKQLRDSFCNLPERSFGDLQSLKTSYTYARGSTIFLEGQPAKGVYILCSGSVKLSTYSEEGKAIILRFANPGEILGLSAVMLSTFYEKTAQAIDDCVVSFIEKRLFLNFVQTD